jgi:hypothetical protein
VVQKFRKPDNCVCRQSSGGTIALKAFNEQLTLETAVVDSDNGNTKTKFIPVNKHRQIGNQSNIKEL